MLGVPEASLVSCNFKARLVSNTSGVYTSAQTQPRSTTQPVGQLTVLSAESLTGRQSRWGLLGEDPEDFDIMLMRHELLQWNEKPSDKEMKEQNKEDNKLVPSNPANC